MLINLEKEKQKKENEERLFGSSNLQVHKGRPLMSKGKKQKLKKSSSSKSKYNQADLDRLRYVGQIKDGHQG